VLEVVGNALRPLARSGRDLFTDLVDLPLNEVARRITAADKALTR